MFYAVAQAKTDLSAASGYIIYSYDGITWNKELFTAVHKRFLKSINLLIIIL